MSLREHVQNSRKPQGEEGFELLDRMNSGDHELMAKWCLEQLKDYIAKNTSDFMPDNILDIGCGGGANLVRLHEMFVSSTLNGVDYSEVAVEKTKRTLTSYIGDAKWRVNQGTVASLDYHDGAIDLATAFETVYFWPNIEESFKEVHRIIADGGLFVIGNETDGREKNLDDYKDVSDLMKIYSEEELIKLLHEAGFKNVDSRYNVNTHWICLIAQK